MLSGLVLLTASDARSRQNTDQVKVAAVQLASRDASKVDPRCAKKDNNCAIEALIRRAHRQGAALVVTPEYSLDQRFAEPTPKIGLAPTDTKKSPLLTRFSALARELGVYLAIHLETTRSRRRHNTQVAFEPNGQVVGVHHKFELYGSEKDRHTPGTDVMAFETPFGRVGMLVCADVYGDPRLHDELANEHGARIIALSTKWTVPRATNWQAAFARDWGVYVVAANASAGSAS